MRYWTVSSSPFVPGARPSNSSDESFRVSARIASVLMFGRSDIFMDMVRQGYQPVYRPRTFDFREIVTLHGQVTQKVHVVGPDGRPVTAFYPMVQLPDGAWRINGCFLQAPDEHQA